MQIVKQRMNLKTWWNYENVMVVSSKEIMQLSDFKKKHECLNQLLE